MELPLISIILVTSDASINREASFRSCVSQSYTNRELIVVDIGPTVYRDLSWIRLIRRCHVHCPAGSTS
jgi:hypothetical protein